MLLIYFKNFQIHFKRKPGRTIENLLELKSLICFHSVADNYISKILVPNLIGDFCFLLPRSYDTSFYVHGFSGQQVLMEG